MCLGYHFLNEFLQDDETLNLGDEYQIEELLECQSWIIPYKDNGNEQDVNL